MFLFQKTLHDLKNKNRLRQLQPVGSASSNQIVLGNKVLLQFGSNNYLGLADHPELKRAATAAIEQFGVGMGASRCLSGNLFLYDLLEQKIALLKQTEAALVLNSGYTANLGVLGALIQKGDGVFSDRCNHASLIEGCRHAGGMFRLYRHKEMDHLEALLAKRKPGQSAWIVTEGVFSMEGDIAPLPAIVALAEKYDAMIYLDDAHATGVLGGQGGGTCDYFQINNRTRIIQMGTLSKALGGFGGFVAGDNLLIQYLINRVHPFIYTTALPPALIAAAIAAMDWMAQHPKLRQQLLSNADYFRKNAAQMGWNVGKSETPIVPILVGDSETAVALSAQLDEAGIYVPAIRPPTIPKNTSRLRVTLMATHTHEQIDFLLTQLHVVRGAL